MQRQTPDPGAEEGSSEEDTRVRMQDPMSRAWDRTGRVVEVQPHWQYTTVLEGSGRIAIRNRPYLRAVPAPRAETSVRREGVEHQPVLRQHQWVWGTKEGPGELSVDRLICRTMCSINDFIIGL